VSAPLLEVRGLRITSGRGGNRSTIADDVALTVEPGETVGIVGESGSGKSLTARAIMGLLPPGVEATGEILYRGRQILGLPERQLREFRGTQLGLVLQDPFTMLSPLRRCGRHVDELLRDEHGRRLSRSERRVEAIRRLREVGIDDPSVVDRYPFQLSGGMRQRVGLAAALARDPNLLIADEPSTALDVTTQKEILALLGTLQERRGMGLVLITHDLRVAFERCDRVYVLYAGALLEVAPARALEVSPLHPYTLGLLLSEPAIDRRLPELVAIPGSVPPHDVVADRCAFSTRCAWVEGRCVSARPPLVPVADGRLSACVRLDEIYDDLVARRALADRDEAIIEAPLSGAVVVRVEQLVKRFGPVTAVGGVSVQVGAGESVGIVGESGSGKTTLARCLVGLETPDEGTIEIAGIAAHDLAALSGTERRALRRTVQMVFQDPYSSLNPVRTVGATLAEALGVAGRPSDGVGPLLRQVGLPESYSRRKPVSLSGGERQRVAIARALAVEPRVIICDEPVSALDVSVQAQILNLLSRLRRELGLSYVFITHDLAVVRQVVDRVYVLYRGEVVESGGVDQVLDRPSHGYTTRLVESVPGASRHGRDGELAHPFDEGDL
jgi:peptide/nickel transport system ATP-binding protein